VLSSIQSDVVDDRRGMDRRPKPAPRYRQPERRQATFNFTRTFDELIDEGHPARTIWRVIEALDLSRFGDEAKAREGHAGRPALSPAVLLTLWLYGISRGVGSARQIARMTTSDDAYRWIVGDLSVGHDRLSRFRVEHGQALEELMINLLAALVHKRLLKLEVVAQDGTRVRASASAPSFRTRRALKDARKQARLHLHAVLRQADDAELSRRHKAAREAKARDFQRRVDEALDVITELEGLPKRKTEARASTTDPQARVMKMPDGGFRPGYNIQLAVAGSPLGGPRTIVGLHVTNVGSDMGSIAPMLERVERWTGQRARSWLADANHGRHECIEAAAQRDINLVMAVNKRSRSPRPKTVKPSDLVATFRRRAEQPANKQLYKARAGLVELVNAHGKRRLALERITVRGTHKVWCMAILTAIAFNITSHGAGLLG
jgi:transposase